MIMIDSTNMCSHLQRKLFEEDGVYQEIEHDTETLLRVRNGTD